ncbi:hypothetical protein DCCM_0209 [Desulfocucumis palustris]|uniref:Uncharacterized protein n=1 Tax=Desulfocucumis palustris TaxID=1898651 RepID=A0A2L2X7G3_9FIRM|nr:hypothetical protein DCCM_0209 [Desulfocucumis palustris]
MPLSYFLWLTNPIMLIPRSLGSSLSTIELPRGCRGMSINSEVFR